MDINKGIVQDLLEYYFGFNAELSRIAGDEDANFSFSIGPLKYIAKISNGEKLSSYFDFQTKILLHLNSATDNLIPIPILNNKGNYYELVEVNKQKYWLRIISWVEGKLWSDIKFFTSNHYYSLGQVMGNYNLGLKTFDHKYAHRKLEWDLSQADWVGSHLDVFEDEELPLISYFYKKYRLIKDNLLSFRKSVIHNDANDNNVLLNKNEVVSIIDFGDAVFSQVINDLAIGLTYAMMNAEDIVESSKIIVRGFHETYPLKKKEIECLYTLVGVRLIISLTKSRQNYLKDPSNSYHQISVAGGWRLIRNWKNLSETLITAFFKNECGYEIFDSHNEMINYLKKNQVKCMDFIGIPKLHMEHISFDIESTNLGLPESYLIPSNHQRLINAYCDENNCNAVYGGYLECRPFYTTEAFRKKSVFGINSRTIHLGEDYWIPAGTPIYAPLKGKIKLLKNNDYEKDYGPTIVMEHTTPKGLSFYTLYGHLDSECLGRISLGQSFKKGDILAYVGDYPENGNWAPHLHFQIILDLLEAKDNFPGVASPNEIKVWKKICPNPKNLIDISNYPEEETNDVESLKIKREIHISKALSLSYDNPLHIVRGAGSRLIDKEGQQYLDMVNNVAHVGHEHPYVVKQGQKQMAVLNTNSRYLHKAIIDYSEAILKKFPDSFTKVFFVNSGSEANDLALRMARTFSGKNKVVALRHGYHGHTQASLDVSSYKFEGKGGYGRPDSTFLVDINDSLWREKLQKEIGDAELDNDVAGSISESILSCAGQVVPDTTHMQDLFKLVKAHGGINIADEVQTGFGRVGSHFWAFEMHGLDPDIVTLGKPMGNGHPIGALVCKSEVVDRFENGMEFFATYGGNPVSCVIGKAVLDIIEQEKLQKHALELGLYMKDQLTGFSKIYSCIHDVRGSGLFLGIEFRKNGEPDAQTCRWIVEKLRNKKILLSTDGPYHNVIKIKPPMVISKIEVDVFLSTFEMLLQSWF